MAQQGLDGAALVHGLVTLGGLVQRHVRALRLLGSWTASQAADTDAQTLSTERRHTPRVCLVAARSTVAEVS